MKNSKRNLGTLSLSKLRIAKVDINDNNETSQTFYE